MFDRELRRWRGLTRVTLSSATFPVAFLFLFYKLVTFLGRFQHRSISPRENDRQLRTNQSREEKRSELGERPKPSSGRRARRLFRSGTRADIDVSESHRDVVWIKWIISRARRSSLPSTCKLYMDEIIGKSIDRDTYQLVHLARSPTRFRFLNVDSRITAFNVIYEFPFPRVRPVRFYLEKGFSNIDFSYMSS